MRDYQPMTDYQTACLTVFGSITVLALAAVAIFWLMKR